MSRSDSGRSLGDDVFVALLRGINVGGANRLPMRELQALLGALGCREVRTYIQSGNAVFVAPTEQAAQLPGLISEAIGARSGLAVPVVLRRAAELAAVAEDNPFLGAGADPCSLHVLFLAEAPDAAAVARLDPDRSPPDAFVVRGREVYLCCPDGLARSKLTNAYFDRALGTTSTGRNWRTVLTLVEMSAGTTR